MTVHSEAEAVRQAKEYLDIGFVVNAIKRPDGSIAHDQDQLSALHRGFDDLALKLAEKRTPRNHEENDRGCRAAGYSCQEVCSRRGLQGRSGSRRRIESGKEAVEPKGGSQD